MAALYAIAALACLVVWQVAAVLLALPQWVDAIAGLMLVASSTVFVWWLGQAQPLTVQAEQAQSGRDYRALFQNYPLPLWLFDENTWNIVEANRAAVAAYGYSDEQFQQLHVADLYMPQHPHLATARTFNGPLSPAQLAGVQRHADAQGNPVEVHVVINHNVLPAQGYSLLIAQHVQGAQPVVRGVAQQQKFYERMVNSLPEAVLMLHEGRIQYFNAAAVNMFGAGEVLRGAQFTQYVHVDARARETDRLQALQMGYETDTRFRNVRLLRLDGREFEAEVAEIPLEYDGQRDVQLLVRDVSEPEQMRRALQDANQRLQHLSQRLIEVQETERRQLARDLHDDLGQQLTGLKLHLLRLVRKLHEPDLQALAEHLLSNLDQALNQTRSLSLSLHPLQLETLGLEAAVRWHLSHFLAATPTEWSLTVDGELERVAAFKALAAFRVIQEAVNNIARHAEASRVQVRLRNNDSGLTIEILDDGNGFDPAATERKATSLGLTSMRERVAAFGGQLRISSVAGIGTRVTALIPATGPSSAEQRQPSA